jgi:hypothetical protein
MILNVFSQKIDGIFHFIRTEKMTADGAFKQQPKTQI